MDYVTGDKVRAFDPRTFGVVKVGRIVSVGRTWARIDFGITGTARVRIADIVGRVD